MGGENESVAMRVLHKRDGPRQTNAIKRHDNPFVNLSANIFFCSRSEMCQLVLLVLPPSAFVRFFLTWRKVC